MRGLPGGRSGAPCARQLSLVGATAIGSALTIVRAARVGPLLAGLSFLAGMELALISRQ